MTTQQHTALIQKVRETYGRTLGLIIHHNSVPVVRTVRGQSVFTATPGLGPGSLDLVCGITVEHVGRRFLQWVELDAKTGKGVAMQNQEMRIALVRKLGGFAGTFHSPEEFGAAIERARAGEHE